jgi:type IV pilus assembly protein PilW
MSPTRTPHRPALPRRQHGLTLVEFLVSITIGLLLIAAVATLIADQSASRAEVDRAGRLIENGRYGVRAITDDLQLAGYWGELSGVPTSAVLTALPDPCLRDLATLQAASQLHIQGYNAPASGAVPSCILNQRPGTDILVVRHAEPDSSSLETGGVPDLAKLTNGQLYIQTGLNAASSAFVATLNFGNTADNAANFPLVKKDKVTLATIRKVVTRIYYIANCSVEVGGGCAGADGGKPIPTLKMRELAAAGGIADWSDPVTIAEGIENLQVDYGVDTSGDGAPEGDDVDGGAIGFAAWADVMSVKVYLLARSLEKTPGFEDTKTYSMGTAAPVTPTETAYKRHVFVQSIRLVNPSARRST